MTNVVPAFGLYVLMVLAFAIFCTLVAGATLALGEWVMADA